eukprot:860746-Ditylum_brightwellii.AAC.1
MQHNNNNNNMPTSKMVKTETRLQTKLTKAPAVKSKAPLMVPGKNESLKGNVRGDGLGYSCLSGSFARST